jgi:hypothetical protein
MVKENPDFRIEKVSSNGGTRLEGYLNLKYNQIKKIFGKPNFELSGDSKIEREWIITINGTLVTIYNYKTGPTYLHDRKIKLNDIYPWHIGGRNRSSVDMLRLYLSSISDEFKNCVETLRW